MRSPLRNALISLVPFYGISSFWYLGRKDGIWLWIVCTCISFSPLLVYYIAKINNFEMEWITLLIGGIYLGDFLQFGLIYMTTQEKNEEEKHN